MAGGWENRIHVTFNAAARLAEASADYSLALCRHEGVVRGGDLRIVILLSLWTLFIFSAFWVGQCGGIVVFGRL